MRTNLACFAALAVCLVAIRPVSAQLQSATGLHQLTRPAGFIFAGRVLSVQYLPTSAANHVPTMQITFQVEQGLRGVRTGRTFTIRQWAGLWNEGVRYRTGDRLVLFLYPPSNLGLTSPVGGARGKFILDRHGQVLLGMERAELLRELRSRVRGSRGHIHLRDFMRRIRQAEEK